MPPGRFDRVVVVTPRDTIATDVAMTTRQGISANGRAADRSHDVMRISMERGLRRGRLDIVNVYNGDARKIEDVALLTYSTPRAPNDVLVGALRAAGIEVVAVGDARAPQEMLFAAASGHAAGDSV